MNNPRISMAGDRWIVTVTLEDGTDYVVLTTESIQRAVTEVHKAKYTATKQPRTLLEVFND